MFAKFFSLTFSEFFLRGSKFLFFLILANLYEEKIIYEYSYFTAIFSVLFVFTDFGIQTYLAKELSSSSIENSAFKEISSIRVAFFVFLSIPVLIFYFFSQNEIYFFIFLLFVSDAIFAMHYAYLRANLNSFAEAKTKIYIAFFYFLTFGLLLFDLKLAFLFLALLYLIYALISSRFLQINFIYKSLAYLKVFKKSLFIFIGSLFTIIYLRVDIIMLSWMDTQGSVAVYSIASRVLELSLVFPFALSSILLPILTKKLDINFKKDIIVQVFIGIVVLFVFLFFSNFIINFMFPRYSNSVYALNILLFSIPIMLVNNYIFLYFIAKDMSWLYALIAIVIAFSNIILNYLFIPKFSYIGASFTTIFTEFFGMILALFFMYKKGKFYENSHNS